MKKAIALGIAALAFWAAPAAYAQNAAAVLQQSRQALGDPTTIQYVAAGSTASLGQPKASGQAWPLRPFDSVTVAVNYDQASSRREVRFKGGPRMVYMVNGDKAWSVDQFEATAPVPLDSSRLARTDEFRLQILTSPHGFVRAALQAGNATVRQVKENGEALNVVAFKALDKYPLEGFIDSQGLVRRVQTLFPNAILGDMAYVVTFSDYKPYGAVKFPSHIVQSSAGFTENDYTVTEFRANTPVNIPVPGNADAVTTPLPSRAVSTQVADGVWFVGGSLHHSVVVAFKDFVTVIEAPVNEERSQVVIAEARRLAPGKPIRYIVSSHHHFDHSGGLRTYVAEGATVVTHASHVAFWEKATAAPATIMPDALAKKPRKAAFQPVNDKYVITDGAQSIELHHLAGDTHSDGMLFAYVPAGKLVVVADSYSPEFLPFAPPRSPAPAGAVGLYDTIQRLKLDVTQIVGAHGPGAVPMSDLERVIGKK